MTKRAIALLAGCLFIAGGLFWGTEPAAAQTQGRSTQVVSLQAVRHAVSPPLYQIPPSPPKQALRHAIPLRPTHAVAPPFQPRLDPVLQQPGTSSPLAATASAGFQGIGEGLGNFSVNYVPPDTNGAVGATQYVQWVNASYAVFDKKTGAVQYGPADGNTIWSSLGGACAANNSGDPIAQYDKQAGRWVLMQPVFNRPYYLCIAVSTGSDATGSYNLYQFAVPNNVKYFPDYPKLAVWPDGYYISFNTFQGNSFLGPTACVVDRSAMLAGQNASMQCTSPLGAYYGSLLPSDLDGDSGASGTTAAPPSGSPDYYLAFGTNSLNLWEFHVDWSNANKSSFTGPTSVSGVAAFSEACGGGACIPQPGTSKTLDSLGDRLMYRLAYRNFGTANSPDERMVVSHSVATGNGNTGVRWYEIRSPGSNPTVYQQGTYSPDSASRWMPSIAMDKVGDIALGYSESSSGMYPSIYFTGRVPGDNKGDMETENLVVNGTGSQTTYSRWGDYSSMSVDPADDCTFWYTNEYLQKTGVFNWSTWIFPITFSGCSSGSSSVTVSTVALDSYTVTGGNPVTGTVTLNAKAPSGGALVTFTSSNHTAAPDPTSLTISQGQTSGTFTVNTNQVSAQSQVTITASYNGSSQTTPTLTVNPVASTVSVSTVALNSYTVTGGNAVNGTVTLSGNAPAGGALVTFTSSNPSVVPAPASVTVAAGTSSQGFTVNTNSVQNPTSVTITASYNGSSQTTPTLTVNPASGDFSLSATPGNVTLHGNGGQASYSVTVTPSGGFNQQVDFSMTSSPGGPQASFSPQSVTGSGTTTMTVTAPGGKASYTLTIIGSVAGVPTHSITVGLKVR